MDTTYTGWRTSSYTYPRENCVEVGRSKNGKIGVRDTKGSPTTILQFSPEEWRNFLSSLKESKA